MTHDERVERVQQSVYPIIRQAIHDGRELDLLGFSRIPDPSRDVARAAVAAIDADPLEDVLLSSGLVSEGLPGYDVAIAHDDGEWYASQQQVTMNESWPTGIVGTGPTINAAIHDAVEKAKEAT